MTMEVPNQIHSQESNQLIKPYRKPVNPTEPCIYCNKPISIKNITTHHKKCKKKNELDIPFKLKNYENIFEENEFLKTELMKKEIKIESLMQIIDRFMEKNKNTTTFKNEGLSQSHSK